MIEPGDLDGLLRRLPADPLEALNEIVVIRERVDEALVRTMCAAVASGATTEDVAAALGLGHSLAEERGPDGVPEALRTEVRCWFGRGSPVQGPSTYDRQSWLVAFPEQQELIALLPERLNRADTRAIVTKRLASGDIRGAFLVSQIWGYGRRGYGPYRVRKVLDEPEATDHLAAAIAVLAEQGPVAAFAVLAGEHRIRGLGPAFFTKFLFFSDPAQRALVLDDFVAAWFKKEAGVRLRLAPPRPEDYERYLQLAEGWAAQLGISPEDLEQLVFSAEAATRPSTDWILEEPTTEG